MPDTSTIADAPSPRLRLRLRAHLISRHASGAGACHGPRRTDVLAQLSQAHTNGLVHVPAGAEAVDEGLQPRGVSRRTGAMDGEVEGREVDLAEQPTDHEMKRSAREGDAMRWRERWREVQ